MRTFFLAAPAACILLSGCQAWQTPAPPTPQPNPALVRVVAQQQVLWQEGVINTPSALPADALRFDHDRVSVTWDGDAIELLSHLARQRGLNFTWTGVRLPLPVNVHAQGVTYLNLLHLIEMQISWRARIYQYPGQLALAFAQPLPPAAGAGGRKP